MGGGSTMGATGTFCALEESKEEDGGVGFFIAIENRFLSVEKGKFCHIKWAAKIALAPILALRAKDWYRAMRSFFSRSARI